MNYGHYIYVVVLLLVTFLLHYTREENNVSIIWRLGLYQNNGILAKGQISNNVKTLQDNLIKLGFLSGKADGAFGTNTENAVKAFQRKYNLTADGLAGQTTLKKINELIKNLGKPSTPTNPTTQTQSTVGASKLSAQGFELLESYEVGVAGVYNNKKLIGIKIQDINDGAYTIGYGNAVSKTDTVKIQEYKDKYGVDVTKVGEMVDIATCRKIYNDQASYYKSTVDSLLKRCGYNANQNEYDALIIAVYNRPALASKGGTLEKLINDGSRDMQYWHDTIMQNYKDNVSESKWNSFNKGWSNRVYDELELYFNGDYTRNH